VRADEHTRRIALLKGLATPGKRVLPNLEDDADSGDDVPDDTAASSSYQAKMCSSFKTKCSYIQTTIASTHKLEGFQMRIKHETFW
jgi:hypothetical protein